jgi:putative acetyltransferase
MNIRIRPETGTDKVAIFELNAAAFPTDAEARLVDALRESADSYISLVAVEERDIIGHIMFTPVSLGEFDRLQLMGLAPMAVAPSRQRRGIGTLLVDAGLERCKELGTGAVVVLGHPEYYPRFGFEPASKWGIKSEYDVPDDVFMLLELSPGYLNGYQGTISYNAAFADV